MKQRVKQDQTRDFTSMDSVLIGTQCQPCRVLITTRALINISKKSKNMLHTDERLGVVTVQLTEEKKNLILAVAARAGTYNMQQ